MSGDPVVYALDDGRVRVEWPEGRQEWTRVAPEVIEGWAEKVNALVDQVEGLRRAHEVDSDCLHCGGAGCEACDARLLGDDPDPRPSLADRDADLARETRP